MDNNDVNILIETFKGYRDLLAPIQNNLNDFVSTYDMMKEDIDKLNTAFGGDVKGNLEKIYHTLASQAEKATDLSSRIDQFVKMTTKYTSDVTRFVSLFEKVEERITAINDIESKAEEQIGKLDGLLEEKKKSYNIRELQKTLDNYNDNVQKVGDFINKDIADSLNDNYSKLDAIKSGNDSLKNKMDEENGNIVELMNAYRSTNNLLNKIVEKEDVNESYIFDILDKWATARKVKIKK